MPAVKQPFVNVVALLALTACGGGSSSTGIGTQNSPFVGEYPGTSTLVVRRADGSAAVSSTTALTSYVTEDGMVYLADDAGLLGSALLRDDHLSMALQAGALLEPMPWPCQGEFRLTARLSRGAGDQAVVSGSWEARELVCDGVPIQVSGSLSGARSNDAPLLSQVLETDHQALIGAIGELLNRGR